MKQGPAKPAGAAQRTCRGRWPLAVGRWLTLCEWPGFPATQLMR